MKQAWYYSLTCAAKLYTKGLWNEQFDDITSYLALRGRKKLGFHLTSPRAGTEDEQLQSFVFLSTGSICPRFNSCHILVVLSYEIKKTCFTRICLSPQNKHRVRNTDKTISRRKKTNKQTGRGHSCPTCAFFFLFVYLIDFVKHVPTPSKHNSYERRAPIADMTHTQTPVRL